MSSSSTRVASPFGGRHSLRARLPILITFLPWMLLILLFSLAPAAAMFPLSFTNLNGFPGVPMDWIGFNNYELFFSPSHWQDSQAILTRTAIFCLVVSGVIVFLAMAVAILLNMRIRGSNIWRAIIFLPTILGVTVVGLTWSLILNPVAGPVASLMHAIGFQTALLGDPRISFYLIMFIMIWSSLGFAVVIYIAALQSMSEELYEAATIDGANAWKRFTNITFPLLAPAMSANILIAIIGSLQSYQLIYVLTNAKHSTSVLASLVLESGFLGGISQGYAASVSIIQFVLILVVTLVIYFPLKRRENRLES